MKQSRIVVGLLIVAVVLAAAVSLAAPAGPSAAPMAPEIARIAAEAPDQQIAVIVQKATGGDEASARVTALGGAVTRELNIINALVAEMPAGALPALAADPSVRWVSLDAPLAPSAGADAHTIRDDFNVTSYENNDGTELWASPWFEPNDGGNVTRGNVQISNAKLVLKEKNQAIARSANLAGAVSAHLTFEYKRVQFSTADDIVFVEVSDDGGAHWTVVGEIGGPTPDDLLWSPVSINISAYATADFRLRLRTGPGHHRKAKLIVEYVEVSYTTSNSGPDYMAPTNTYPGTVNIAPVRAMGLTGQGVGIAVVDSGVHAHADFVSVLGPTELAIRLLAQQDIPGLGGDDMLGHGTMVAGVAAGNGMASAGAYEGVAPGASIISVKVSDDNGMALTSDAVAGLEWVLNNKELYKIRVVNLSMNSTTPESYHVSPLDAAAEILWFNGIVVVASAGNVSSASLNAMIPIMAAPANDPFIITVGSTDEHGDANRANDTLATFSASGFTLDGHMKPDVVAPGKNIIAPLSAYSTWPVLYPDLAVAPDYFQASGTSLSAPMVAGTVALMVEAQPDLTPDQVKYRLMHSGTTLNGTAYLDVYAAVTSTATASANTGLEASLLLWSGDDPIIWDSVNWNSVNWNSVNWNSVNWNSVNWNSVTWTSLNFGN